MGFKLNPLIFSGFDISGAGSGAYQGYKAPVANAAALPSVGNTDGDMRITLDTSEPWVWDATSSYWLLVGIRQNDNIGSSPNDQGYTLSLNTEDSNTAFYELTLQPGDATHPGILSLASQAISGDKTFNDDVSISGVLSASGGVSSNLIPTINNAYDLGSSLLAWRDLYARSLTLTNASITALGNLSAQSGTFLGSVSMGGTSGSGVDFKNTAGSIRARVLPDATIPSGTTAQASYTADLGLNVGVFSANDTTSTGNVNVESGNASSGTGISGNVVIRSGTAGNFGSSGNVILQTGATLGTRGQISLNGRQVDVNNTKIVNVSDPTLAQDAATKNYTDTTFVPLTQKGAANGVATLDGGGKVPVAQLPSAVMTYEGVWNASTNSPTLADGVGDTGMVYRVGTAGTQNLGSGPIVFDVGDYVIYNGTVWEKSDTTDAVASVNGLVGIVVLDTDDISEGASNLYFTNGRAQSAITGGASSIVTSDLTIDRALISNGSGKVAVSAVTNLELGYVSGVTSAIQTQLNGKQATITGAATTVTSSDLTADRAVISDGSGKIAVSAATSTEVGYLSGVTSAIQTQINSKQATITGAATTITSSDLTASRAVVSDGSGKVAVSSVTSTELGYVSGVTSSIQTQINTLSSQINYVAGDIAQTSFSLTNNQVVAADVTGLAFAGTVRSAQIQYSITIDATTDLFESGTIYLIQKNGTWDLSQTWNFDNSNVIFTVTNAGQVQYTSANYSGFVSGTMKFRATVTSV